jgi:hypothetical protein
MESRTPLDLASGFFLHAVVRFDNQVHEGLKIFWEAGPPFGGPKVSIGLDNDNALFFRVTGARGDAVSPAMVSRERYGDTWLVLWCGLQRLGRDRMRMIVAVNGAILEEKTVDFAADQCGTKAEVNVSLGTDVLGQNPAAFTLGELLLLGGFPTVSELNEFLTYIHNQFKLGPFTLGGNYGGA